VKFCLTSEQNTINIEKNNKGCTRTRKLSHLTQTAIGPKTVGFENIVQQAQSFKEIEMKKLVLITITVVLVLMVLVMVLVVSIRHAEVRYTVTDLGVGFEARAINDNGQVVGGSDNAYGLGHAFLYEGTTMTAWGGNMSCAWGINDNGQVVGRAYNLNGSLAFLYDGTTMKDLGTLGGYESQASAINDNGQVVGTSGSLNGGAHAFLYDELDGMLDLNNLIASDSGWLLGVAIDINSFGQIVGNGSIDGEPHAYLLTPVP
jgi:probable HAF family extracellular repeat protein